jgi:hypothetical protein
MDAALTLSQDIGKNLPAKLSVFRGPLFTDTIRQKHMRNKHVSLLLP